MGPNAQGAGRRWDLTGPAFVVSFESTVCSLDVDVHSDKQKSIRGSGSRTRPEKVLFRQRSVGPNARGGGGLWVVGTHRPDFEDIHWHRRVIVRLAHPQERTDAKLDK